MKLAKPKEEKKIAGHKKGLAMFKNFQTHFKTVFSKHKKVKHLIYYAVYMNNTNRFG